MNEELFKSEVSEPRSWRSAASLFHPVRPSKIRARQSLPGQKFLPGMECQDDCGPPPQTATGVEGTRVDARHTAGTTGPSPQCPNCGATEFDEDGDCAACLEPDVIEVDPQDRAVGFE
jgi:hypothetical protein